MAARNVPLYVGAHGTVIAINRDTGDVLWTSELKGGEFVDVMIADGDLFAASKGRLYRLDPATGDVLWRNDLPGMGWGIVSIAGSHRSGAADKLRQNQAAATTAVVAAS